MSQSKLRIALFGQPVAHSLSPLLFSQLERQGGPEISYEPIDVPPGALRDAVLELRRGRWDGANVTTPHKQTAARLVDELDDAARSAAAVNVLARTHDGALRGSNTDGAGFLAALDETLGQSAASGDTLILGAGGAARGIAGSLLTRGAALTVVSRDPQHALDARGWKDVRARLLAWSDEDLEAAVRAARLIVQATPLGSPPHESACVPLAWDALYSDQRAVDLVYAPWQTPFLERARARGLRAINGWPMLVRQAALALDLWAGEGAGRSLLERAASLEPRDPHLPG